MIFDNFVQWLVANKLFQGKMDHHNQEDGSRETPKLGYLHGKYGFEIRICSVNRDNTHSWVRISHGSNKFVMNLNNNETEIPEDKLEEYALKLNAKDFACRSKAKAKPTKKRICWLFTKNCFHWKKELD